MTSTSASSRFRITTPGGKFAYVFLATVAVFAVAVVLSLMLGQWAGVLSAGPLLLVIVGYAARQFRDPEIESLEAPRLWWRMTARPASGYVFGAMFLAQAAWVGVTAPGRPDAWALLPGVATEAFLGVGFLRSSRTLGAMRPTE